MLKKFIGILIPSRSKKKFVDKKFITLMLNSNPWFSAVTDYSLQMALSMQSNNIEVFYGAEKKSTVMDVICKKHKINFFYIPIHNVGVFNILRSLLKLIFILSSNNLIVKNIYVFEGREHSLLIVLKVLFPFYFYRRKIIRVRGQSQKVKNNFFSKLVYKYYTDYIIFVANCVFKRVPIEIPKYRYEIQYYCKDLNSKEICLLEYRFGNQIPELNLSNLTYLVLGRFDPVKGHDMLMQTFTHLEFQKDTNLVLIGKSENIMASDLFEKYKENFEMSFYENSTFYLAKKNLKIYIIDEKLNDIYDLMSSVHFGIIPSLDSEVICRVGVEFLQSGVPCLYSNAGALPEVFSDFPQFEFQKGNIEDLKKKIIDSELIYFNENQFKKIKQLCKEIGYKKFGLSNFKSMIINLDSLKKWTKPPN